MAFTCHTSGRLGVSRAVPCVLRATSSHDALLRMAEEPVDALEVTRSRAGPAAPRRGASPCARGRAGRGAPAVRARCSISLRAAVPMAWTIRPPAPIRMPFCDSVSAHTRARTTSRARRRAPRSRRPPPRPRAAAPRACAAAPARAPARRGARSATGRSAPRAGRGTGPPAAARSSCSTSSRTPSPVLALTGKISPSHAELGRARQRRRRSRGCRAGRPCSAASRPARPTLRSRLGDEAVAGADLLLAVQHEQRGVGVARARAPPGAACAR